MYVHAQVVYAAVSAVIVLVAYTSYPDDNVHRAVPITTKQQPSDVSGSRVTSFRTTALTSTVIINDNEFATIAPTDTSISPRAEKNRTDPAKLSACVITYFGRRARKSISSFKEEL